VGPGLAPAIFMRFRSNARNVRLAAIGTIAILLIVGYVTLLPYFHVSEMPVERDLGLKSAVGPIPQIYIEPISIGALNNAMQMRVSFAPRGTLYGERLAPTERRLRLVITHDQAVEEIGVAANARPPTTSFEIDLNGGSVADYPLDSYHADLRIQLFEDAIPAVDEAKPLAAKVTVWEGALGFHLRSAEHAASGPGEVRLNIEIRRGGAFILFALAAYGAMVVLSCCALAIGLITFVDARRAEATLIGAIAAIVFAMPVLRNVLPGAPPLGVRADMFVFLWTVLAAVIGLALVTLDWARTDPRR
jgi:Domain of unknown function (DUF4436)